MVASKNSCKELYTFDTTSNVQTACLREKKCGSYMYLGLQTYTTLQECVDAWNTSHTSSIDQLMVIYHYDSTSHRCIASTQPVSDPIPKDHYTSKRECMLLHREIPSSSCGCGRT